MIENHDYVLTPGKDDHWNIRILQGPYVETVFNYGTIKVSDCGDYLKYDTEIVSHQQDDNWDPAEDVNWQEITGRLLIKIVENSLEDTDNGSAGEWENSSGA